jgi:hypothetical protein
MIRKHLEPGAISIQQRGKNAAPNPGSSSAASEGVTNAATPAAEGAPQQPQPQAKNSPKKHHQNRQHQHGGKGQHKKAEGNNPSSAPSNTAGNNPKFEHGKIKIYAPKQAAQPTIDSNAHTTNPSNTGKPIDHDFKKCSFSSLLNRVIVLLSFIMKNKRSNILGIKIQIGFANVALHARHGQPTLLNR